MINFLTKNNLRDLRKKKGLSQWKLGLFSGVQQSRISLLEQGLPPNSEEMMKIANTLGVNASDIWNDKDGVAD